MPHLVTRVQAIGALQENPGECFLCRLLESEMKFVLERSEGVCVFLSAYPRFWGQVMIVPEMHTEKFSGTDLRTWELMNRHAHKAARILEKLFSPARVYIASTGSAQNLPMTCPHIHINVIPVPDAQLKPSEVFTWANGLYAGTEEEWESLFRKMQLEWKN